MFLPFFASLARFCCWW